MGRKTLKMTRFLGKTLLVVTLIIAGCATDKHRVDGRLIKVDGKYYRLENRLGNVYALEPINMDTIIVIK